jgi:predicted O-methyltransferase YrrM
VASNTRAHVHFIAGHSANSETMASVKGTLGDSKVDFLMIDGDHSRTGVGTDFELYSPLVKSGGLIAFHDILPHPKETGCEVDQFWTALKGTLPVEKYAEFCAEPLNWGGIGVIKW